MNRIAYVNGEFVDESNARISIFDRGFLFADGVYEVTSVIRGRLIDNAAHLARLERSMSELQMPPPASPEEIVAIQEQIVARNRLDEGLVYLQVTRGAADRDFAYPSNPRPSLVMFSQARSIIDSPAARNGVRIVTLPDLRWRRRDIKTVGLLAASMAKQAALARGADDAWLYEDGFITEGTSSNAYIVNAGGEIVTRHLGHDILPGITRAAILRLSEEHAMPVVERAFSITEARQAREAFFTSASSLVCPVVRIDETKVGTGEPGPVASRLRELYIKMALAAPRR